MDTLLRLAVWMVGVAVLQAGPASRQGVGGSEGWAVAIDGAAMKAAAGEVSGRLGGLGAGKTPAKLRDEAAPGQKQPEVPVKAPLEIGVWRGWEEKPEEAGRPVGVMVFVWPGEGEHLGVPEAWKAELARRRVVFVWPKGVGNGRGVGWRLLATVVAARQAMEELPVDSGRVYVAGLSGGGRMAGIAGLTFPDLFTGAMPICGVSHYHNVPTEKGGKKYYQGFFPGLGKQWVDRAKRNVFVLVTGTEDGNCKPTIRVSEVMAAEGFGGVRLQVEEGMGHTLPGAEGFARALAALDEPAMNEAAILAGRAEQAELEGRMGEALRLARQAWGRDETLAGARDQAKRLVEMKEKERKEAEGKAGLLKKWEERWK